MHQKQQQGNHSMYDHRSTVYRISETQWVRRTMRIHSLKKRKYCWQTAGPPVQGSIVFRPNRIHICTSSLTPSSIRCAVSSLRFCNLCPSRRLSSAANSEMDIASPSSLESCFKIRSLSFVEIRKKSGPISFIVPGADSESKSELSTSCNDKEIIFFGDLCNTERIRMRPKIQAPN